MKEFFSNILKGIDKSTVVFFLTGLVFVSVVLIYLFPGFFGGSISYNKNDQKANALQPLVNEQNQESQLMPPPPPLDTVAYDKKLNELANNPPPPAPITKTVKDPQTGEEKIVTVTPKPLAPNIWPVKAIYPNAGAIFPFSRIIAFYGNLYSTKMGVLGQYPEDIMLSKLGVEVQKWQEADPATPVLPSLHYIAVVAQGSAGVDGKYRARMPYSEIDKVLAIAAKINAIVFLDIQLGFSTVQNEIPLLEKYLKMPQVHLAIDPEFSMKNGIRPGKVVGTLSAADINYASNYLANIVRVNNLRPKILIIHRYTQKMVTDYKQIKIMPEVQMLMNMDGWGVKPKKINTYQQFIYKEPVLFTGFKLFYKNDTLTPGSVIMTPSEVLKLQPRPIYIQYQ